MRKVAAGWFGVCRKVWNACVDMDVGLNMSMIDLRKKIVSGKDHPKWVKECPCHVRSEVVREYIAARTAALSRYDRLISRYEYLKKLRVGSTRKMKPLREPKRPVMHHRTKKAVREVIHIPKEDVTVSKIGFSIFRGVIKNACGYNVYGNPDGRKARSRNDVLAVTSRVSRKDKEFNAILEDGGVKHDVRLLRYRDGGMYVEAQIDRTVLDKSVEHKQVMGIDPGVRTPLSCATTDGTFLSIGEDFTRRVDVLKGQHSQLQSKLDGMSAKRVKSTRQRMRSIDRKIINIRTQFHYETIRELTKYEHVVLPETNYRGWMTKGVLSKDVHRHCQQIAHPMLRARLIAKVETLGAGRVVSNCDEYRTSKVCGNCFSVNDGLGSSKMFRCPQCGIVVDRDFNAARNILLLSIKEVVSH